jgi:hypothetical protein
MDGVAVAIFPNDGLLETKAAVEDVVDKSSSFLAQGTHIHIMRWLRNGDKAP